MISVSKSRYLNIDALRGIAAFLVVIYHLFGSSTIFKEILKPENLSLSNVWYFLPGYGYVGVYLFFVISGFCIHLRWAKEFSKGNESPKINFISFWKRRWVRLYPAYLAAIVLFLLWQYSQGELHFGFLFIGDMISHILMVHNMENRFVYSMNGVFWTLAIEEQLYLIYFLLLWMRKKLGWTKTLIICFAARYVWFGVITLINGALSSGNLIIFNHPIQLEIPIPEGALANWWIWALGAFAVENYLGIIKFPKWFYSLTLSFLFIAAAAGIHYAGMSMPDNISVNLMWFFEPVCWGAGFFFLVNRVMQYENKLKSRVVVFLATISATVGLFSYSLYLTHEIILQTFSGFSPLIVIALSLIFAYLFFLVFEKPFMIYLSPKTAKAEVAQLP